MKKFCILFLFISSLSVNAQPEKQAQVQKVVKEFFECISNHDTNELKIYCTRDILILENGIIWTLDTLIEKAHQNKLIIDFKRVNTIDFINTIVNNKSAWTTYYSQAEVTRNGQRGLIKWLETAILVKEENIWKIKVLHSTVIKRITL